MPHVERFVFHGTAAALSGRVHRPQPGWIETAGASALPVEGGISRALLPATDLAGVIRFASASTHAQGEADEEPVLRGPRRKAPSCTHAHTGAEIRGLAVGGRLQLTARRIRAELTALCPLETHQPSIGAMDGAAFDGIAVGRHRLSVTIDRRFFRTHDTHDKLCALCEAPHARALPRAVLHAPVRERGHGHAGPAIATIVKSLRWIGRPFPKARLDGHVATIPGFGRVYFGEMLVSGHTRRLTMLRFELDGEVSLDAACCEVEAGGAWAR